MVRARARFVTLLLGVLLLTPAGVAQAHDELVGTDPADGATVQDPDELVLTFSGSIADLGAQVAVTGPGGQSAADGAPEVEGTDVTQELADDLPAGDYAVIWRVTSEDGHPISGELGFTVEAADDSATSAPTTVAPADPSASASATDAASDDPDVTAEPAEAQGAGGLPVWAWLLVGVAAAGLLGLLARTWARGRE